MNTDRPLDLLKVSNWTTRDGLPQNTVQAICQTRNGYIWLGTQEGLVRFDGTRFDPIDRGNSELQSNDVQTIIEDPNTGYLWIGTIGGGVYSRSSTGFREATYTIDTGLRENSVPALEADNMGGIWIGTSESGLDYLSAAGEVRHFSVEDGIIDNRITALCIDRDFRLWVGTAAGLLICEDLSEPVFRPDTRLAGMAVTAMVCSGVGDRGLWIGTTDGLYRLTADGTRRFDTADGMSSAHVLSLFIDDDHNLLVGTNMGIARYTGDRFESLRLGDRFGSDVIASVLVDREGSIWAGTATNGLFQLKEAPITTYTRDQGLSDDVVYAVAPGRSGGLWIGSYRGDIDRYLDGEFTPVVAGDRTGSGQLRAIHEDSRGRIWIGTETGLFRFHAGEVRAYRERDGLPPSAIRAIVETRDGSILIGTDGLGLYQFTGDRIVQSALNADLPSGRIRVLFEDRDGDLWIGSYGGLTRYSRGAPTHWTSSTTDLPSDMIRTILQSADGTLWIGTYGGGLIRFDDDSAFACTSREGLHSDSIFQILEDDAGSLWMSSNTGIFSISIASFDSLARGEIERIESISYTESDGMRSRECNGGSPGGVRTADGRLWFPPIEGLASLDLNLDQRAMDSPIVISRFQIDGVEQDLLDEVTVPPTHARIEFDFTALNFRSPERVEYEYRLDGYDDSWILAEPDDPAIYTGLGPGRFRFEVRETGSQIADVYHFTVAPAFYETPVFYLSMIILAMGLVFGAHRRRVRALMRSERELKERVEEALDELIVLKGMLPICSFCKKIRDDSGYWEQMEVYVRDHSEAEFSHSLCPECMDTHYPEFTFSPKAQPSPSDTARD